MSRYELDYYGAVKYIKLVCKNMGLGLVFHETGTLPSPYTDGKNIHLEKPHPYWTVDQWLDWRYRFHHEIGHEHPRNSSPHWKEVMKSKKVKGGTILGSLCNLISDHIQEHNRIGEFRGVDEILKRGRCRFVTDFLLEEEAMTTPATSKYHQIFRVASVEDTIQRGTWNPLISGLGERAALSLSEEEQEMLEKLHTSGIRLDEGENEEDAYTLSLEILALFGEKAEDHETPEEEEEEEEGEGGEGAGELSEEESEAIASALGKDHYESREGDMEDVEVDEYGRGPDIEYPNISPSSYWDVRDPLIVDLKNKTVPDVLGGTLARKRAYEAEIRGVSGPSTLSRKVRNLIISKRACRNEHLQKQGRISARNLWRANKVMNDSRIFRKKVCDITTSTAISLVVDNSGSMRGSRYAIANRCSILLTQAMQKANVPVEVINFAETYEGPINMIVKPFSENRVSEEDMLERCGMCGEWLTMNSDGESILWAYNRLRKREEGRKVMIVLSDGQPCAEGGTWSDAADYLKFVAEQIEANKEVELYGVGIETDSVEEFYKDSCVIQDVANLENTLLDIVKKKVIL